jgi:hypothetical protein
MAKNNHTIPDGVFTPEKKDITNTTNAGSSIIIHPALFGSEGPHPFLLCLPYGTGIFNKIGKSINPNPIQIYIIE